MSHNDYLFQLLRRLGLSTFTADTLDFLLGHVLKILLIVVVTLVVTRIAARLARRSVHSLALRSPLHASARAEQRAQTIGGVMASLVRIVIWTVAGMLIVDELGFNLGPLIAGASIVGVALGFGAQSLVKDFLSGFFILVEDQYGVGDTITVADASGTVEEVNLRVTRLRAADGTVCFVPNGEIRTVANATKEWSKALVDVAVDLDADVSAAIAAIGEEATALSRQPEWADAVLEPPEVLGVEAMGVDSVTIRVAVKTVPARRTALARALRARVGERLRTEGLLHHATTPGPAAGH